jgi:hypothetical protein
VAHQAAPFLPVHGVREALETYRAGAVHVAKLLTFAALRAPEAKVPVNKITHA